MSTAKQSARFEAQVQMLKAQNEELKRLLRLALQGCADCPNPEFLRRVLEVNVPGPLLRAEISAVLAEQHNEL